MSDNTKLHPSSVPMAHLIDLFLFQGAPVNHDPAHEVTVLINHGYVLGFSRARLQPLWAAYRVAGASAEFSFDRPHLYYADERLGQTERLDNGTFGTHDGIAYHVGHMVPNAAIDRNFGRLAQMETFFMSNMSPQRGSLNRGLWRRLEDKIRQIEDSGDRDHVWAVSGPVFGDDPVVITRRDGKLVPVPEAYYCITVDPFRYPYDRPGNVDIACFLIPQDADSGTELTDYLVELDEIEARTRLTFMPGWANEVARETMRAARAAEAGPMRRMRGDAEGPAGRHRLLAQL